MVTLVNRAKMTTSTTGTGTITLGSAVDGYQTFASAGVVDGDEVRYTIEDGTAWEIGSGTYTSAGTALTRTVDESSDGGTAISLSGNAVVFVTAAGDDLQNAADMNQGVATTDSPEFAGITLPSINGGPLAGFRNAIINGNFDHWQRGTSFTGFEYGADRWYNVISGSSATQSRQAFALGQTDVPNEPEYFCRTAVTSSAGAGNFAILTQRIEGVRTFAGQTVTLSFYAKADAAKDIAVEFTQNFGTGGSPSAEVTAIDVTTLSLTTSWQKFTVTVDVPSISGKTLGTNNNDFLLLDLWFDAGSNFNARTNSLGQQSGTFDIAQVQLEAGSVATSFERRPVGTELALCQRYYEQSPVAFRLSNQISGDFVYASGNLKVPKRAAPAATTVFDSDLNTSSRTITATFTRVTINGVVVSSGVVALDRLIAVDAEL